MGEAPQWFFSPCADEPRTRALEELARFLQELTADPLAALLAERATELASRSELARHVGTDTFSEQLAAGRHDLTEALPVARAWAMTAPAEPLCTLQTSGRGRTLEEALRERLRALALNWPVLVRPELAALAATGDGFVVVADGRSLSEEMLARTVVHEVEGHVLAGIGSAGGVDAQEGWALLCEERAGLLTAARKHELAWRTLACARMLDGGNFVAVRRQLVDEAGFSLEASYALAERLFRGSAGARPGLGREAAYLVHFLGWRAHLEEHPDDEAVAGCATVTPRACAQLRAAHAFEGS